jgi:hypothetical protein
MDPGDTDVVIVRYENDIDVMVAQLQSKGFTVKVYDKHPGRRGKADYFVPENKGNEASGFLQYIVEHYHCLPKWIVFLHDHETSWHHEGNIVDRVQEHIGTKRKFVNLNTFVWTHETIEWFPCLIRWYKEYMEKELGPIRQYGDFMTGHKGCAQFIVHRDVVRKRSATFYTRLYAWIMRTDMPSYYSGRHLEYTWHLMWGQVSRWNGWKQTLRRAYLRCRGMSEPPGNIYTSVMLSS